MKPYWQKNVVTKQAESIGDQFLVIKASSVSFLPGAHILMGKRQLLKLKTSTKIINGTCEVVCGSMEY